MNWLISAACLLRASTPMQQVLMSSACAEQPIPRPVNLRLLGFTSIPCRSLSITILNSIGDKTDPCLTPLCEWGGQLVM